MVKIKNDRDEMAFSDLFDFLAPKLKTYFIQNGFRSENSEELAQEVLSNVWSKSDKYNSSKSAVSTWVYTIARNKKIDYLRKTSRVKINEDDVREFLYSNNEIENIDENENCKQIKCEIKPIYEISDCAKKNKNYLTSDKESKEDEEDSDKEDSDKED